MCCGNCACQPAEPARPENGAAATCPDEEFCLAEKFGEPNADGIYGAVVVE